MSTTYAGSGLTSSGYDVVVIYTNASQIGANGLGNTLTEFVSSGGHIISGVFLWNLYPSGFTHSSLTPFESTGAQSQTTGNFTFSTSISISNGLNSTLGGGTFFTNGDPTLSSDAVLHATFTSDGRKLLAIKEIGCSKLIGINTWFGSISSNTSTLCKMLGRSILYSVGQLPEYEPSPSVTPTQTPTTTPTQTNTQTPSITPTITVTSTITPTNTQTPSQSSTTTPTNTQTPTPTNTPTPTTTPTPTPSPNVTTTTSTTTQVVPITTLPPNQPSSDTYSGGNKQFASTYGSKPMGLKIPIQSRTRSRRFFRG